MMLTAARINSGTAAGRRIAVGNPIATTASSTTVATNARSVVREDGTASAFQMPPSPARLPRVPSPGSARAANAARPDDGDVPSAPPSTDAASHGVAASTDVATIPAAQRTRGTPGPATATHTNATMAASIRPVGVSPARAIQNTTAAHRAHRGSVSPLRNRTTAAAVHGRQP